MIDLTSTRTKVTAVLIGLLFLVVYLIYKKKAAVKKKEVKTETGTKTTDIVGYTITSVGILFIILGLMGSREMPPELGFFLGYMSLVFTFIFSKAGLTSILFYSLGFLLILISHFLFKRKEWAWILSFLIVILFTVNNLYTVSVLTFFNVAFASGNILVLPVTLIIAVILLKIPISFFKERKIFFKKLE